MASEDENRLEQDDEIEALQSMYPDDFKLIEGTAKPTYRISIFPTEPADDEVNHIACELEVEYPLTYPSETGPNMKILPLEKLTSSQITTLEKIANDCAEENIGCAAVFMVIGAVSEWLTENNEDPGDGSVFSEMMRRQRDSQRAQEEAEAANTAAEAAENADMTEEEIMAARRKLEGTPCTDETFNAWNTAFMAEVAAQRAKEGRVGLRSNKAGGENDPEAYMTGKQWFERKMLQSGGVVGTLGDSDDEDTGAPAAPADAGSKPAAVDVNAAIFLNAQTDDLDLDDFSDEDE